jgi:TrpR family trp operon transcriptional repressor
MVYYYNSIVVLCMNKKKYFNNFVQVLLELKDKELLEDFLKGVLTVKELDELPKRLEIVQKLLQGEPQHKIAKDLSVGIATVTRGSRELKLGRFKVLRNLNN